MKMIIAIIIATMLAMVSEAQLTHDSIRVRVDAATPCPASWTRQTEAVVSPALFYIRAPLSIGGVTFLVTEALVDRLWDTAAKRASAVAAGTLEIQPATSVVKSFCALLPVTFRLDKR